MKALIFSADQYKRSELDKMSDKEKYELAHFASNFGYDEACVATLSELQELINNRTISFDSTWVYFVEL